VGPRAGLDTVEKRKFLTLPGLEEGNIHARMRARAQTHTQTRTDAQGSVKIVYRPILFLVGATLVQNFL
jgi:hypothetical protein